MQARRAARPRLPARTECTYVHDHLLKDLRVLLLELLRRGGTRGIPFCWERRATHGRREPAGHGVSRSREHGCLQSFKHDEFDVVVTLCREELSVRGRSGADRGGRRRERDECRSTLVPVERSCVKEEADGEYTRPGDTHTTAFDCALKRVRIQRIYFDFSNRFARDLPDELQDHQLKDVAPASHLPHRSESKSVPSIPGWQSGRLGWPRVGVG